MWTITKFSGSHCRDKKCSSRDWTESCWNNQSWCFLKRIISSSYWGWIEENWECAWNLGKTGRNCSNFWRKTNFFTGIKSEFGENWDKIVIDWFHGNYKHMLDYFPREVTMLFNFFFNLSIMKRNFAEPDDKISTHQLLYDVSVIDLDDKTDFFQWSYLSSFIIIHDVILVLLYLACSIQQK